MIAASVATKEVVSWSRWDWKFGNEFLHMEDRCDLEDTERRWIRLI